ncbi:hypothetical protein [Nocardia sp. BMG51109]|uniref:hypothetical protein n=1 Tax=Nocardia sp. BMG51109 TaxID=1056816 RepID=UPI0004B83B6B|nr:hypothetical protein [Nocardia sp. BMG51109]
MRRSRCHVPLPDEPPGRGRAVPRARRTGSQGGSTSSAASWWFTEVTAGISTGLGWTVALLIAERWITERGRKPYSPT